MAGDEGEAEGITERADILNEVLKLSPSLLMEIGDGFFPETSHGFHGEFICVEFPREHFII